jgi:hypothetical protein
MSKFCLPLPPFTAAPRSPAGLKDNGDELIPQYETTDAQMAVWRNTVMKGDKPFVEYDRSVQY